jgi:hypothetical protein
MSPTDPPREARHHVLDPAWEDELRRGQAAADERGSVDAELGIVHLLRHSVADEPVSEARLREVWRRIDVEVGGSPASPRRLWAWLALPALALSGVALALQVGRSGPPAAPPESAKVERRGEDVERQFALLEAAARGALSRRIDDERMALRRRLLAEATSAAGGAP